MGIVRLGNVNCNSCCHCCSGNLPTQWSVDLTNLGLTNVACDACTSFNATYILQGSGGSWSYSSPTAFFCRAPDGAIWAGAPFDSDEVVFIGYSPSAGLTRTPLTGGGCLWSFTWTIASAWEYVGDDGLTIPCATPFIGGSAGGGANIATYTYTSPLGESCRTTKHLTQTNKITACWAHMMHVAGQTNNTDNQIEPESTEAPEGTFIDDGAFCAGLNFPSSITLVAG